MMDESVRAWQLCKCRLLQLQLLLLLWLYGLIDEQLFIRL